MSNVGQHIKDEAKGRGIVPGATIACVSVCRDRAVVPQYDEWEQWGDGGVGFKWPHVTMNRIYIKSGNCWAEIITPAPSSEPEGLKEGDSVECGPAMRAAIIELANELGLATDVIMTGYDYLNCISWSFNRLLLDKVGHCASKIQDLHTPEAFIAKMRVEAAKPKPEPPIKIGSDKVEFRSGSIKVGCTTVDNATVRAIAQKLID